MQSSLSLVLLAVAWQLCASETDEGFPKSKELIEVSKLSAIVFYSVAGFLVLCAAVLTKTHWQYYIPNAPTMNACLGRNVPTVHIARVAGMVKFLLFDTPDLITTFWFLAFCILARLENWLWTLLTGVSLLLGVCSWLLMACSLILPERLCAFQFITGQVQAPTGDEGAESTEEDVDEEDVDGSIDFSDRCRTCCCNICVGIKHWLQFWHHERKQLIYRGTVMGLASDIFGVFVFFMVENFDARAQTMPLWLKATEVIVSLLATLAEMAQGAGEFFVDEEKTEEWQALEEQNVVLREAGLAGLTGAERGDEALRNIQTDLLQHGRFRRELLLSHKTGQVHDFLLKDEEVVTMLEEMVKYRNQVIRDQRRTLEKLHRDKKIISRNMRFHPTSP